MFCSDYPRGLANCLRLCWFPVFHTLPIASALPVPFLLACRRLAISLLGFPPRPLPRRLPAEFAAIALARLPRMKALFASFQQTTTHPRPAAQSLPPNGLLIFELGCRTLERAHGR